MAAIPLQDDVYYPESDGKPMGETQVHAEEITYVWEALCDWYRNEPDVYVWGNLFFYYVKGSPRFCVCPDVFVVKGVPKEPRRRICKVWEEGKVPDLVIEVTSDSTQDEDTEEKRSLYERLGVDEYILFDPFGDYLSPHLQGFSLAGGRYRPIPLEPDGSLLSRTTGLRFRVEGERIQVIDPATGIAIPRDEELRKEASEVKEALARERFAREEAEARAAALEKELARLRARLP
jgi:Uma2 family endonuclease